ncbi:MAG TPA: benzoylformate decarboxylase, partial [Steroidobacteraceae bacterium]|nr:benzoylformate decarboxylase [Steroidobacteraceae bacterium]
QQARSMLSLEPFLYSDQAPSLPRPYVKWSCEPARAEDVPAAIARAYYAAMQPPRGPTFVSIPVDDWEHLCGPVQARQVSASIAGDPALLAQAAAALSAARRPVIVVGASVARDGAWEDVIALAERHQALVWASPRSSRNSFPERHRLFAGFLPPDRVSVVNRLQGADLVLVLGAPVFTYHVETPPGPHLPPGASLIQLVDDPAAAAWAPVGMAIVTNLQLGIAALLNLTAPARTAPAPRAPPEVQRAQHLTEPYLMQQIAALRPTGTMIVEEAPSARGAMQEYLPMDERDTFYTCASGGLGHGLPAAIGVALGRPGRKVIALLGDGSAMYSIQGLWTAAELGVPVVFIIINNHSYYGLVEFARHFKLAGLPGTQLPHLDFCALARGHGISAQRVERCEELDAALTSAFAATQPALLEVCIAARDEASLG